MTPQESVDKATLFLKTLDSHLREEKCTHSLDEILADLKENWYQ